jgi:hypothetical protein
MGFSLVAFAQICFSEGCLDSYQQCDERCLPSDIQCENDCQIELSDCCLQPGAYDCPSPGTLQKAKK